MIKKLSIMSFLLFQTKNEIENLRKSLSKYKKRVKTLMQISMNREGNKFAHITEIGQILSPFNLFDRIPHYIIVKLIHDNLKKHFKIEINLRFDKLQILMT